MQCPRWEGRAQRRVGQRAPGSAKGLAGLQGLTHRGLSLTDLKGTGCSIDPQRALSD